MAILNDKDIMLLGLKGDKGDAATIKIGTVTTGSPNTKAKVENVGTETDAVLNFTIPRGENGTGGGGSSILEFYTLELTSNEEKIGGVRSFYIPNKRFAKPQRINAYIEYQNKGYEIDSEFKESITVDGKTFRFIYEDYYQIMDNDYVEQSAISVIANDGGTIGENSLITVHKSALSQTEAQHIVSEETAVKKHTLTGNGDFTDAMYGNGFINNEEFDKPYHIRGKLTFLGETYDIDTCWVDKLQVAEDLWFHFSYHGWSPVDVVLFNVVYVAASHDGTTFSDRLVTGELTVYVNRAFANMSNELLKFKADIANKVGFTDLANPSKAGVVRVYDAYGITTSESGAIMAQEAGTDNIDSRVKYRPLTASDVDYAVKVGLIDNRLDDLTDEEKTAANNFIGSVKQVTTSASLKRVYSIDTSGKQVMTNCSVNYFGGAIPLYDSGSIKLSKSTKDEHAISRGEVANLPDNITLTDDQKAKWKAWLQAILEE